MQANVVPSWDEMWALVTDISDHKECADEFLGGLIDALVNTPATTACLEIGVYRGGSSILTLWHLLDEAKKRPLITVDDGSAGTYPYMGNWVKEHCPKYPWKHHVADQHQWLRESLPPGMTFGFVYHDGEHGTNSVLMDVAMIEPLIVPNGILVVDDFHQCIPGAAVTQEIESMGLRRARDIPVRQQWCGEIAFFRKVAQ